MASRNSVASLGASQNAVGRLSLVQTTNEVGIKVVILSANADNVVVKTADVVTV